MHRLLQLPLIWLLIIGGMVHGNGLTITNLSRDSLAQTVTFDLEWDNSWRLDATGAPNNWDAAWVFVKFQPCAGGSQAPWSHGQLSTTLADHSFGDLEPVLSDGSGVGIDPVPQNTGVMLRRSVQGLFGDAPATTVTLYVPNMLPNEAYNVRVVGIEMVYVPSGTYDLGGVTYSNAFSATTAGNDPTPLTINSEAAQTISSHAGGVNGSVALPAAFPKGFAAFHLMKYEISQGQYATFLNTLSSTVQYNRYPGNAGSFRNALSAGGVAPEVFVSSRPDRAQNYLSWADLAAYLDWAALRPMTEMEFEKACRGLDPVAAGIEDYAWGDNGPSELTAITGPEDGSEIPAVLPANAHYTYNLLGGGDGGYGPVRVGIFALPTSASRVASGAGYYGAMELSGNVGEACVRVSDETSTTGALAFTGAPGDGQLGANAGADEAGWPSLANPAFIFRGGSFDRTAADLRVADRSEFTWNGARDRAVGGRGVRQ
jgi:formylglycine-generating enzyme required for sulfatase activity